MIRKAARNFWPWAKGALLLACVAALLAAYGERNMGNVRPVLNMFHWWWNCLVPALAF